jgi:hypothetical protein
VVAPRSTRALVPDLDSAAPGTDCVETRSSLVGSGWDVTSCMESVPRMVLLLFMVGFVTKNFLYKDF